MGFSEVKKMLKFIVDRIFFFDFDAKWCARNIVSNMTSFAACFTSSDSLPIKGGVLLEKAVKLGSKTNEHP